MIKVCHILSGDLWAGAEVVGYQLIQCLNRFPEIDVSAVILNNGGLYKNLRNLGIRTWLIEENSNTFLTILDKLERLQRRERFEIIHSHRYKENFLAFLLKLKFLNLRIVTTQHGMPEIYNSNRYFKKKIISLINFWLITNHFNAVAAVSNDIKSKWPVKDNKSRLRVIHNGIKIGSRYAKQDNDGSFTIGSAGRFTAVKNFSLFVSISKNIIEIMPKAEFVIAGDGDQLASIEKQIENLKLKGSFKLMGHVENMQSFYKMIDIYMNTSLHEGIPVSILEAMSVGIPTIAPRIGGIPEIIDSGINGFLVGDFDPLKFSKVCCLLIENRELRKVISENAKKTIANNFSDIAMGSEYHRLYKEII